VTAVSDSRVASMKTDMDQMESEFDATTQMVVHQQEKVSELAVANDAFRKALRDQSWLTYVAMKEGYQVESWLANDQPKSSRPQAPGGAGAAGLIAVRVVGNEAVLQVNGLEPASPGYVYTLWLIGNGAPWEAARFEVSEIGSATFPFLLPAPLTFFSSIAVTQERSDSIGSDPSGVTFLSADTK
ncbi:MAG: anti-sigma factor, partial [Chloroflexi bacterium]|nr:anti-sigma factor [Chloroflexota bacterium]